MLKYLVLLSTIGFLQASEVLDLTDADFADKVKQHGIMLVKFYAPWCGHCKRLAPEFDKAASLLSANDPPVTLAKLDCTVETKTCGKYGVSGYPTLKIFRSDPENSEDYNGPREHDGIFKYMRSKAGPSSKNVESVDGMESFLKTQDVTIVGFFDSNENELAKQFSKLADAMSEDFRFGHSFESSVSEKYSFSNNIVLFRPKRLQSKFEDAQVKYEGSATIPAMKEWVRDNVHGLCGHRTTGNTDQFKNPLVVAYYDVDYVKNTKGTNYWRNRVMKIAKELNAAGKKVNYAISNRDDFSQELSEFGIEAPSDKPVVAGRNDKDQKFIMEGEFSMDRLKQFVVDLVDDKLTPYLKSEAIPETNEEPVKVVVAKEFDKIVNDDSKDVLIEFYAPWCGHCKSLAPKYDELAGKLENEPSITIAKMDATANDVPKPYEVHGFPTIYFAPKGQKDSPRKYEGGREVKDFLKYLAKESTDPLVGYDRNGKKLKKKTEL
ncbi:DgyrCDS5703 [Dimorphilus gyrociliatus]|uniref:Protein disulfide-isomerase n=1 Tax=Dimorphilus gyrociliatus TaxID=2664684 RepID=A0A7I8VNE9_9ANNE|nr:DgyrCDS5703 [Dimorphilus gyrociliatus]